MPWPRDHKQETRQRIVEAAASAFREHGIEQTTVAEIMQQAGLTHGGFYAHFQSKDELVAEAVKYASEQVSKIFDSPNTKHPLLEVSGAYLSVPHMAHPERGCPVAALATELNRGGQKVRNVVSRELQARLEKLFLRTPPDETLEIRRRQAAGVLACMVGGQILARALNSNEAAQFLADCQGFLDEALAKSKTSTE